MDTVSTDSLLSSLKEGEKLGDEIVGERRKIVDMDRIRNKNREALGALRRPNLPTQNEEKVWMNIGDFFVRTDKDSLITALSADQKFLDEEIDRARKELKPKVVEMNKFLGKPEMQGFDLQPLSADEMSVLHKIAPRV